MSMRGPGGSGRGIAGANRQKAVLYMTIGIWSSTILIAGLLAYSLGVRRHHTGLGLVIGGVYLVVVGAGNALYLRKTKRQFAQRCGGGSGLGP